MWSDDFRIIVANDRNFRVFDLAVYESNVHPISQEEWERVHAEISKELRGVSGVREESAQSNAQEGC
jgi:hypothetical protein